MMTDTPMNGRSDVPQSILLRADEVID